MNTIELEIVLDNDRLTYDMLKKYFSSDVISSILKKDGINVAPSKFNIKGMTVTAYDAALKIINYKYPNIVTCEKLVAYIDKDKLCIRTLSSVKNGELKNICFYLEDKDR